MGAYTLAQNTGEQCIQSNPGQAKDHIVDVGRAAAQEGLQKFQNDGNGAGDHPLRAAGKAVANCGQSDADWPTEEKRAAELYTGGCWREDAALYRLEGARNAEKRYAVIGEVSLKYVVKQAAFTMHIR